MQSEYRMVYIGVYEWLRNVCTVDVPMCSVYACVCVQGECGREEAEEEGCGQMVKDFMTCHKIGTLHYVIWAATQCLTQGGDWIQINV